MAAAGSTAMVQAGTAVGTAAAGWANAAGTAVAMGMASNGAISTINNRGNLGMSSGRDLQRCAEGLCSRWHDCGADCRRLRQMDLDPDRHLDRSTEHRGRGARRRVGHLARWGQFTSNQLLQNGTSVLLDRALGGKGSLGDALQNSLAMPSRPTASS